DGHIFALENRKLLFNFVLEDAEIFRLQPVGEALPVVDDCRVQNDQIHVEDNFRTLLADVGILAGRRRRGYGNLSKRAGTEDSRSAEQKKEPAQRRKETPEVISGWGRNIRFLNTR